MTMTIIYEKLTFEKYTQTKYQAIMSLVPGCHFIFPGTFNLFKIIYVRKIEIHLTTRQLFCT